ncbi:MAG: hypothetical protein FJ189_14010, partial [Gammaproteobacteria bacterium]|nr:hypothetical protein [Gammaproteobacteria bacterium]
MSPMRWHKGFETGEAVIDEQHRALLELIEQVASATSESPFGPAQQAEFLDRVTEWAISHFATEDALMRDVGLDPGY